MARWHRAECSAPELRYQPAERPLESHRCDPARCGDGVVNVPLGERINPTLAFLLLFPGAFLVVPVFVHYWYVTRHQNRTLRAA